MDFWTCGICTLINSSLQEECEVCGGPRWSAEAKAELSPGPASRRTHQASSSAAAAGHSLPDSRDHSSLSSARRQDHASSTLSDDDSTTSSSSSRRSQSGATELSSSEISATMMLAATEEGDPDRRLALQLALEDYDQLQERNQVARKRIRKGNLLNSLVYDPGNFDWPASAVERDAKTAHQSRARNTDLSSPSRKPWSSDRNDERSSRRSREVEEAASRSPVEVVDIDEQQMKQLRIQKLLGRMGRFRNQIARNMPSAGGLNQSSASQQLESRSRLFLSKLHQHQEEGVAWLRSLHLTGINGLLADEMGLGKTIQVLYFLTQLLEQHGVWGPHLVILPLSVMNAWETDINTHFRPNTFYTYFHHGGKEERMAASSDFFKVAKNRSKRGPGALPGEIALFITTYDLAILDRYIFSKFRSLARTAPIEYLIIDEGHRLKNKRSVLFRVLKQVPSKRRLLLTGTPIQNSLPELWALLSFLLPKFFAEEDDLMKWFNRPFESDDEEDEEDEEEEEEEEVGAAERKGGDQDVAMEIAGEALEGGNELLPQWPIDDGKQGCASEGGTAAAETSKRVPRSESSKSKARSKAKAGRKRNRSGILYRLHSEALEAGSVSSMLSSEEKEAILSCLHQVMKPFLLRRIKSDVAKQLAQKVEKIVFCPYSSLQVSLFALIKECMNQRQAENAVGVDSGSGLAVDSASPMPPNRSVVSKEASRLQRQVQSFLSSSLQASRGAMASQLLGGDLKLSNLVMQLRKLCNHPFLILHDVMEIPDDKYFGSIIESSGKLKVLHALLPRLLHENRKILIFSQMTSMLDIIFDSLQMNGVHSVRLDGRMSKADREESIRLFNAEFLSSPSAAQPHSRSDPLRSTATSSSASSPASSPSVFLLSTRAGGLGLNLQVADTIILYDSDFNPQADLQAIARAHRLNSVHRQNLLVLRLVSTHSQDGLRMRSVHHTHRVRNGCQERTEQAFAQQAESARQSFSIEEHIYKRAFRKYLASKEVLKHGAFDVHPSAAEKTKGNPAMEATEEESQERADGKRGSALPEQRETATDFLEEEDEEVGRDWTPGGNNACARDDEGVHSIELSSLFASVEEEKLRSISPETTNSTSTSTAAGWVAERIDQASFAVHQSLDLMDERTLDTLCDRTKNSEQGEEGGPIVRICIDADTCEYLQLMKLRFDPLESPSNLGAKKSRCLLEEWKEELDSLRVQLDAQEREIDRLSAYYISPRRRSRMDLEGDEGAAGAGGEGDERAGAKRRASLPRNGSKVRPGRKGAGDGGQEEMESGVVTAWGGEEEDDGEGMGVEEKGRLARSRRRSNSPSKANRKSEQKKKTERGSQSAARKEKLDETDFCALCGLCSLNALDLAALRQYMGTDTIGSSAPSLSDVELCTTLIFCDSCDITYHLACVGLSNAPTGQWFCRFCEIQNSDHAAAAGSIDT